MPVTRLSSPIVQVRCSAKAKDRLAELDANLTEQQEILELAASLATRGGDAYRKANDRTRKLSNTAVSEFEYGTRVVRR